MNDTPETDDQPIIYALNELCYQVPCVDLEFSRKLERERDEAREKIENLKLQLGLWEDGNIICEETLGEIRLLKEQIDRVLLERNEAHKIAERAIDDLAWFNETNAQRLRAELDKIKEGAR